MRILLIELRSTACGPVETALQRWGASTVHGLTAALEVLNEQEAGVIVLDLGDDRPGDAAGVVQTLDRLLDRAAGARIIVTGSATDDTIQTVLAHGAFDFVTVPDDVDSLGYAVDRALRQAAFERMPVTVRGRRKLAEVLPGILTSDPAMRRIARRIERLAGLENRLLLQGEPGTGRASLARLAVVSGRHGNGLQPVEPTRHLCHAGTSSHDIDELFSRHRTDLPRAPGSLPARRPAGLILEAVDELGADAQATLTRRLLEPQHGQTRRADGQPVRVLATATAQLGQRIANGQFRRDLYDQLAEVHLCLPALRQRGHDPLELIEHYIGLHADEQGRSRPTLSPLAVEAVREHDWPGNVSELRNAARQAVLTGSAGPVTPADLGLVPQSSTRLQTLREAREDAERAVVQRALKRVNGNIARASEMLGISRPTLYDLLNKLNLR